MERIPQSLEDVEEDLAEGRPDSILALVAVCCRWGHHLVPIGMVPKNLKECAELVWFGLTMKELGATIEEADVAFVIVSERFAKSRLQ